jgi:hypothetical protein
MRCVDAAFVSLFSFGNNSQRERGEYAAHTVVTATSGCWREAKTKTAASPWLDGCGSDKESRKKKKLRLAIGSRDERFPNNNFAPLRM